MRAITQCSQFTEGCWNCSQRILSHISCGRSTDQDSLVEAESWDLVNFMKISFTDYDCVQIWRCEVRPEPPLPHRVTWIVFQSSRSGLLTAPVINCTDCHTTGLQPSLTHKLYCFSFYPSPPRSNWINGNRINQGNIETNYPSFELSNGILMTSFWFMKDIFTDHNGRLKSNDFLFFICLSAEKVFRAK